MTRRILRPLSSLSSLRLGYRVMLANRSLYQCAKYAISNAEQRARSIRSNYFSSTKDPAQTFFSSSSLVSTFPGFCTK